MNKRPVIHVVDPIHQDVIEFLKQQAVVLTPEVSFPSDCDAVIVRTKAISAKDLAACPNLKIIGKHGSGLDAIDVDAANARGVTVLSTPGANAESVADLAICFALALIRNLQRLTSATKEGRAASADEKNGYDLGELEAGIFGLGAVGRATARRLSQGFGADVHAYDPGIAEEQWPAGVRRARSLDEILKNSRIVFLHAPLLPSTRNLIDAAALKLMPKGSYLVNCARGGIVDEAALAAALLSGHLAGAASDVFAVEPPEPSNPLLSCPTFIATPHVGGATNGALRRVGQSIAEQVLSNLGRSNSPARYS